MDAVQSSVIFIGAVLFAMLGATLLATIEHIDAVVHHFPSKGVRAFIQGKTIVGGLLGGLVGVEWAKKIIRYPHSTGDDMTSPIIIGICIGRIGCFLTGISDDTIGIATNLVVGIDFGDGIRRHPTMLYEMIFLLMLLMMLKTIKNKPWKGYLFQRFMLSYLVYRWFSEWLKPTYKMCLGMSAIQCACIAGVIYYLFLIKAHARSYGHK